MFNDRILQRDAVTVSMACGLCGSTVEGHVCAVKRYLRSPAVVYVRQLAPSDSNDDSDLFLVRTVKGGEEYTTTRAVLKRDYEEI
jgi:hypothetical protein